MSILSSDSYQTQPPFLPGQKFLEVSQACVLREKYDEENNSLGWYVMRSQAGDLHQGVSQDEAFLCHSAAGKDEGEVFISPLHALTDCQEGRDKAYILGKNNDYIISTGTDESLQVQVQPASAKRDPDRYVYSLLGAFPRTQSGDEVRADRVLYLEQVGWGNENYTTLRDVQDPTYHLVLPNFHNTHVIALERIADQYVNYVVFITLDYLSRPSPRLSAFVIAENKITEPEVVSYEQDDFVEMRGFMAASVPVNPDALNHNIIFEDMLQDKIATTSGFFNPDSLGGRQVAIFSPNSVGTKDSFSCFILGLRKAGTEIYCLAECDFNGPGQEASQVVFSRKLYSFSQSDGSTSFACAAGKDRVNVFLINYKPIDGKMKLHDQFALTFRPIVESSQNYRFMITAGSLFPIITNENDEIKLQGFYFLFRGVSVIEEFREHITQTGFEMNIYGAYCPVDLDSDTHIYRFQSHGHTCGLEELTVWERIPQRLRDLRYQDIMSGGYMYDLGYYFSAACDFSGDSIVLGAAGLTVQSSVGQIFALYKVIPFESQLAASKPSLSVSENDNIVNGLNTSNIVTWNVGATLEEHGPVPYGSINGSISTTYGETSMDSSGSQSSVDVHVMSSFTDEDTLHANVSAYFVWQYPLYKRSLMITPVGYLTIVIPDGPLEDTLLTTEDTSFFYVQDYEVGCLLSYVGRDMQGYDKKNIMFRPEGLTVIGDSSSGSSVSYSSDNSTQKETSKSTDLSVNVSSTLSLGLPKAGASLTAHYSRSEMKNRSQSVSTTKAFSLTFSAGTVNDPAYEYEVIPYVFRFKDSVNLIMVDYEVRLTGPGWKEKFSIPDPRLMRLYPQSNVVKYYCFSRSIRFSENPHGGVDIDVHIFNNSFVNLHNLVCELYAGDVMFMGSKDNVVANLSTAKKLGVLNIAEMTPLGRVVESLNKQNLDKATMVTAVLYLDAVPEIKQYYWGMYPFEDFANVDLGKS